MKLTLRELFLLVALVAMGCAWWLEHAVLTERAGKADYWERQTQNLAEFVSTNCPEVRLSHSMEGEIIVTHNPAFPEPTRRPKP
jgi:hypothetical protein